MQMKEVCARTGLTERSVRFYVEKGLLLPEKNWRNGREYLSFSEKNIEDLEQIAAFRRCFFTLEQIGAMRAHPERIGEILEEYRSFLRKETEGYQAALRFSEEIQGEEFADAGELYRRLKQENMRREIPERDVIPDFGRFDEEPLEERRAAAQQWEKSRTIRERKRRIKLWAFFAAAAVVLIFCLGIGWRWHYWNRQGLTILTSIMDAEVLAKGVDTSGEEGVCWLDIRIPEEIAAKKAICPEFRLITENWQLWEGAVYHHFYPAARLEVFLTNRRMKELGLSKEADVFVILQKVLSRQEYTDEFVRLESFQGEYF